MAQGLVSFELKDLRHSFTPCQLQVTTVVSIVSAGDQAHVSPTRLLFGQCPQAPPPELEDNTATRQVCALE